MQTGRRRFGAQLFRVIVSVSFTACASSGAPPGQSVETVQVRSPGTTLSVDMTREGRSSADTVVAQPERVWDAIPRALAALNLSIESADVSSATMTTRLTQFRRSLDGKRLSRLLSCGASAAGENADMYFVNIRAQVSMRKLDERRAEVRATIHASARPPDNGAVSVRCETTGVLERRILQLVASEALATHGG